MIEESSGSAQPALERRKARGRRSTGETTNFDLLAIQAARRQEDDQEPMLLVIRGVQKGRPIPIENGEWTMGRGPISDVSLQGRGISRTHMHVERSLERGVVVTDARSTNGLFVNGERTTTRALRDGDLVQLGPETVLKFSFAPACELTLRVRQYEHSIVDPLTGIHNRRYLMNSAEHELAFAARHDQPLCLLLLDIDHFKQVNDDHGHQAGDFVLKQLAERIADHLRSEDVFARLGGEEFAVISRGISREHAEDLADRLRSLVEDRPFDIGTAAISCTISVGGSMLDEGQTADITTLLERADRSLYKAKGSGRNRIAIV